MYKTIFKLFFTISEEMRERSRSCSLRVRHLALPGFVPLRDSDSYLVLGKACMQTLDISSCK